MIDLIMPTRTPRLCAVVERALAGRAWRRADPCGDLRRRRVLFALQTDELGMDAPTLALLRALRERPSLLDGSIGAIVVDGKSELYTKQLAQEMALAGSCAGCTFPGKPLVEATGTLYNQHILAKKWGLGWEETYARRVQELVERLEHFSPLRFSEPRLLVLHASESGRSSTLWLWEKLRGHLDGIRTQEISLQNGTIHDCRGCSYHTCLHFASNGSCFYGGALSETVLPAIREADALLFLCPNYNDAVGANITALFNRLTSFLLHSDLYEKYLFGLIVSGYSGSDLVARQLLGAMCLNKTAMLPPHFCMMETANDLDAARRIPGLEERLEAFGRQLRRTLLLPKKEQNHFEQSGGYYGTV